MIRNVVLSEFESKLFNDKVEKIKTAKKIIPNTNGIKCDISARIEFFFTESSFETKYTTNGTITGAKKILR